MTDLRAATPGRFGRTAAATSPRRSWRPWRSSNRVHEAAKRDPSFWTELNALLKDYVGRPTPLTEAPRLGDRWERGWWSP